MKKRDERCICNDEWRMAGIPTNDAPITVHVSWCPQSFEMQEYKKLPWWKKIIFGKP